MSRQGNCYDNVVVVSLFQLLERERIHRRGYPTMQEVRSAIFGYIEMLYNLSSDTCMQIGYFQ